MDLPHYNIRPDHPTHGRPVCPLHRDAKKGREEEGIQQTTGTEGFDPGKVDKGAKNLQQRT